MNILLWDSQTETAAHFQNHVESYATLDLIDELADIPDEVMDDDILVLDFDHNTKEVKACIKGVKKGGSRCKVVLLSMKEVSKVEKELGKSGVDLILTTPFVPELVKGGLQELDGVIENALVESKEQEILKEHGMDGVESTDTGIREVNDQLNQLIPGDSSGPKQSVSAAFIEDDDKSDEEEGSLDFLSDTGTLITQENEGDAPEEVGLEISLDEGDALEDLDLSSDNNANNNAKNNAHKNADSELDLSSDHSDGLSLDVDLDASELDLSSDNEQEFGDIDLSDANPVSEEDLSTKVKEKLAEIDNILAEDEATKNEIRFNPGDLDDGDLDISGVDADEFMLSDSEEPEESFSLSENSFESEEDELTISAQTESSYVGGTSVSTNELSETNEIIKELRLEREEILQKYLELKDKVGSDYSSELGHLARIEELNLEKTLLQERLQKELDEAASDLRNLRIKLSFFEKKTKEMEAENRKLKEAKHARESRERTEIIELENRLDLLRKDTKAQIFNRDQTILELKRQVDQLNFSLNSYRGKEKEVLKSRSANEEKLNRAIKNLKSAIHDLEETDPQLSKVSLLKKKANF